MDPIANMIVQIKNTGDAGRDKANVPYSRLKHDILETLKKSGFVKNVEKKESKGRPVLTVELYLEKHVPKIRGVKRVSKTSKRIYKKSTELRPVKNGYGALILSTPKGVMSDREARKEKVGGEALFNIW